MAVTMATVATIDGSVGDGDGGGDDDEDDDDEGGDGSCTGGDILPGSDSLQFAFSRFLRNFSAKAFLRAWGGGVNNPTILCQFTH